MQVESPDSGAGPLPEGCALMWLLTTKATPEIKNEATQSWGDLGCLALSSGAALSRGAHPTAGCCILLSGSSCSRLLPSSPTRRSCGFVQSVTGKPGSSLPKNWLWDPTKLQTSAPRKGQAMLTLRLEPETL